MPQSVPPSAPQWTAVEWSFHFAQSGTNPYRDNEIWAEFRHSSGLELHRPLFWDGGTTWKLRFASPLADGTWAWHLCSDPDLPDVTEDEGVVRAGPHPNPVTRFDRHGLLRMSPGRRSIVHHDGTPFLLVADTPWALPWRATLEECQQYAADRAGKGFNAALLMTVMPDRRAVGPHNRLHPDGFDVGFEDLPEGRLNIINPGYFQMLDRLVATLLDNGIVPVFQPVFHGFGWRGLDAAGKTVPPEDYARFCRYLVGRYGAQPAIYLVGGDGDGREPNVEAGGSEVEAWDCYEQPTGIHYGPNRDGCAHQASAWLDFQWCQTGHCGEHQPERVAWLWRNTPAKGVANGEPTYEEVWPGGKGQGWWQGHEAWSNLCAGGTLGVVYGAVGLWNWRRDGDPGDQPSWRTALAAEGSQYVGLLGRLLDGLPLSDAEPNWTFTYSRRALSVPDRLFVVYLEHGGRFEILNPRVPRCYRIFDPRSGRETGRGELPQETPAWVPVEADAPRVILFTHDLAPLAETSGR